MSIEEAILLLEHTGYEDFNLLEHQIKGRLEAIKVILKENQELKKDLEEKENQQKEFIEWLENEINRLDDYCHDEQSLLYPKALYELQKTKEILAKYKKL